MNISGLYKRYSWVLLVLALAVIGIVAARVDPTDVQALGHFGLLSLAPAFMTLSICFATRNVILALFMGVVTGGLVAGTYNVVDSLLIPALGTERFAQILLVYLWALGGLLGIWNRNGGAWHFANYVAQHHVKSRRSAMFFSWLMGVIFHQGGTISTVLTGTTVRPVADREKVAHEELAYIVDSTASPVATVIPLNAWPAYVAGLITLPSMAHIVANEEEAVALFISAIPFNFYGFLAITFTLLFALGKLPWVGPAMKRAQERVHTTGELDSPGAEPMLAKELTQVDIAPGYSPSLIDFFVPIGTLIIVALGGWIATGTPATFEAFSLAVLAGLITSMIRGMSVSDALDGFLNGIKGVTVGAVILGLAVTLGFVSETLGASSYVIAATADFLSTAPFILPGLLMIICMVVAFSIGSSWGTYAVVFPIVLPLAFVLSPEPLFMLLTFGAVLGGAVFGDQCSPISDTTILAALACGCDLMDHVFTQLPLALAAAGISIVLYTGIAFAIL